MRGLLSPAVVGSLLLATLSTIADYVWFLGIPQHQVSSGTIHGAALFAALGAYLGWRKGKLGVGAVPARACTQPNRSSARIGDENSWIRHIPNILLLQAIAREMN